MKKTRLAVLLILATACSTAPSGSIGARKIASIENGGLDNNGDQIDDTFDPNLESYFQGSAESENAKNNQVAELFKNFVVTASEARAKVAASSEASTPHAQRIFGDLPKPDYATRDAHHKMSGCFKGDLDINPGLMKDINGQLESYDQADHPSTPHARVASESDLGVFSGGQHYDAVVRVSNAYPGNHVDKLPDGRGLAVKILPKGTVGDQSVSQLSAQDLNAATRLDIVTINFPTFFVNDPLKYWKVNRGFLNSSLEFKNKLASKLEAVDSIFIKAGFSALERKLALWVNGSVIYSPLYQEYYSMVPSRLGPLGAIRAVKYTWAPVACSTDASAVFEQQKQKQWADWTKDHSYAFPPHEPSAIKHPEAPYSEADFPDDFLRVHATETLSEGDFCFNLYVQLYRDPVSTNIEDCTDLWASSDAEKAWWSGEVVPDAIQWDLDADNTESRSQYLQRFEQKLIAPRILVGKLKLRKLSADDLAAGIGNSKTCEDLSFSPWNGDISHHKPLGVLSRMKRRAYNAVRRERHQLNGIDDSKIERAP